MLPSIRGWEWIIILAIVLIVFGVGRLPEIGGALGKAIREFRSETKPPDEKKEDEEKADEKQEENAS